MPYKNRIRLPIMFTKPQFPMERNIFRKANGVSKVLSIVIRNTYEGKTDQLPEDWHRKLVIALAHDTVTIENERLLSDVTLDGDYGIDWQDFLQYPIAPANFTVQVTPFNATNNNCQTCEQVSQLNLVDDSTDEIWDEGTTHDFPDVLTDNDSICCNPFTIELVTYNTDYFENVSISTAGVLTATVKDPVPDISNILIATYRVTCPDGSYDEADVYGNIQGSSTSCPLSIDFIEAVQDGPTSATINWSPDVPPPWSFIWDLYLTSDLGTPVQSGTLPQLSSTLALTGLTAGESYTFVIVVDCSGGAGTSLSPETIIEFTLNSFSADVCGNFTITYLPTGQAYEVESASYMDCNGVIQNLSFSYAQEISRCMLIPYGEEAPVYFVASSDDITITYTELCE